MSQVLELYLRSWSYICAVVMFIRLYTTVVTTAVCILAGTKTISSVPRIDQHA